MDQHNSATGTEAAQNGESDNPALQPALNEARRPQRLFQKVNVAMKLAINRINDRKFTEIGHFLTEEKLADFTQEVRRQIRVRLNETIDTWTVRAYHDYRPDVRIAIMKAMDIKWHLFDCREESGDLNMDEALGGGDEFVPSELLLPAFYDE